MGLQLPLHQHPSALCESWGSAHGLAVHKGSLSGLPDWTPTCSSAAWPVPCVNLHPANPEMETSQRLNVPQWTCSSEGTEALLLQVSFGMNPAYQRHFWAVGNSCFLL